MKRVLVEALKKAKETIRFMYGNGDIGWDIYDRASPEMKQINTALKLAGESAEVSSGNS